MFTRIPHRVALTLALIAGVASIATLSVVSSAAAGPAAKATTTRYGGSTAPQFDPMVLTVRGSKVVHIGTQFEFSGGCGTMAFGRDVSLPIKGGHFTLSQAGSGTTGSGQAAAFVLKITGTVSATTAKGTAQVTVVPAPDASGQQQPSCGSGVQRWSLKHDPKREFSGTTSQGLPAVVELSANGKTVNHFHIGWRAPCTAGGSLLAGDMLTSFPLVAGHFGDSWRSEHQFSNGGMETDTYAVTGKLAKGKASGTLKVTVKGTDAAGATQDSCTSPTVRWSAEG